jgi:hypothetical protein
MSPYVVARCETTVPQQLAFVAAVVSAHALPLEPRIATNTAEPITTRLIPTPYTERSKEHIHARLWVAVEIQSKFVACTVLVVSGADRSGARQRRRSLIGSLLARLIMLPPRIRFELGQHQRSRAS